MKTYSEQISQNGGEKSIFLQQDSPVSLFLVPDQEKERKMTATSGRKCLGELTKSDPIGLLVKTLLESQAWYSPVMKLKWEVTRISKEKVAWRRKCVSNLLLTESATTSKVSVIPSSRLLYQLVPSVRRIEGTESSLLPTVQTQGLKVCNKGKTEFMNLKLLPTPIKSYWKAGTPKDRNDGKTRNSQLNHLIAHHAGKTSHLNPRFAAEMMGFPPNYLELPFLSIEQNP